MSRPIRHLIFLFVIYWQMTLLPISARYTPRTPFLITLSIVNEYPAFYNNYITHIFCHLLGDASQSSSNTNSHSQSFSIPSLLLNRVWKYYMLEMVTPWRMSSTSFKVLMFIRTSKDWASLVIILRSPIKLLYERSSLWFLFPFLSFSSVFDLFDTFFHPHQFA